MSRVFCEFGLNLDMEKLPESSRVKSQALGAGALLDIGIYCLTWGRLFLDPGVPKSPPKVTAELTLVNGIDYMDSIILSYPGKQAILTTTLLCKSSSDFCRIEGSKGTIVVSGPGASLPQSFTIQMVGQTEIIKKDFKTDVMGFCWEADAVAIDLAEGRLENETMPLKETLSMMRLMDGIRKQAGLYYPQDST